MSARKCTDAEKKAQKAEYEAQLKKGAAKAAAAQTRYALARESGMDSIAATQFAKASALAFG